MIQETLGGNWRKYRKEVIPWNAPPVQVMESQRAFYAGAWTLYNMILGNLDEGDEPTPKDLDLMAKLYEEMTSFNERIRRGGDGR
ncbi:MAG TPA: hypothetical protein VF077_00475 [Nitrospiraceae bacterium]